MVCNRWFYIRNNALRSALASVTWPDARLTADWPDNSEPKRSEWWEKSWFLSKVANRSLHCRRAKTNKQECIIYLITQKTLHTTQRSRNLYSLIQNGDAFDCMNGHEYILLALLNFLAYTFATMENKAHIDFPILMKHCEISEMNYERGRISDSSVSLLCY